MIARVEELLREYIVEMALPWHRFITRLFKSVTEMALGLSSQRPLLAYGKRT